MQQMMVLNPSNTENGRRNWSNTRSRDRTDSDDDNVFLGSTSLGGSRRRRSRSAGRRRRKKEGFEASENDDSPLVINNNDSIANLGRLLPSKDGPDNNEEGD